MHKGNPTTIMHKGNPTNINAVIVFDEKGLKEVVPDEFAASPGQIVQWEVIPNKKVKLNFNGDSPFKKDVLVSDPDGIITDKVERTATGVYPYSVIDVVGNVAIDPRIQVKP